MQLKLNCGRRYILNGPDGPIVFSEKDQVRTVPDSLVEKLGLLTERVPQFASDGTTAKEVERFVQVDDAGGEKPLRSSRRSGPKSDPVPTE